MNAISDDFISTFLLVVDDDDDDDVYNDSLPLYYTDIISILRIPNSYYYDYYDSYENTLSMNFFNLYVAVLNIEYCLRVPCRRL